MYFRAVYWASALTSVVHALPTTKSPTPAELNDPKYGPIPGQSTLYSTYRGKTAPFPATYPAPIENTTVGPPGEDDLLFQNLLGAEWVIYSFYQQGVEKFNASAFTSLGYPNTTYDRLAEIRDNEAGHLRIFQDSISSNSLKPGACKYDFGFGSDPVTYLSIQTLLEISSMAFLTGLVQEAKLNASSGALLAVAEVETRHQVWSLIDIWNTNPFAGPSDTVFPYANEVLDLTNQFVVPNSCPKANPTFPYPRQALPQMNYAANTTSLKPGQDITVTFDKDPDFKSGTEYHAVFFHGLNNITVPFDVAANKSTIPAAFEDRGLTMMVLADKEGAPTINSVIAEPLIILIQPSELTTKVP